MSDIQKISKLPTIAELYENDSLPVIQRESLFQVLVNQEPKREWIKKHPNIQVKNEKDEYVPMEYIPIERIEWLLTNIFLNWRVEVKDYKLIGNSVAVCVKLWYFDRIDGEWNFQEGVGAAPLQTDKGAGAIEFDKLKSAAVQMALPSAKSYAVKDAAEQIGKLFGRDVGRKSRIEYEALVNRFRQTDEELRDTYLALLAEYEFMRGDISKLMPAKDWVREQFEYAIRNIKSLIQDERERQRVDNPQTNEEVNRKVKEAADRDDWKETRKRS